MNYSRRQRIGSGGSSSGVVRGCGGGMHDGDRPTKEGGKEMKTLLVGIDGLSWNVLSGLVRDGHMPHMRSFIENGVSGQMDNLGQSNSPVIWTTVATGKLAAEHQVLDFTDLFPRPGRIKEFLFRKMPFLGRKFLARLGWAFESRVGSTHRRCKALWNVFSDMGRSVGVGGWWATYPAEPVNGFVVSDQANYYRLKINKDVGAITLKEEDLSGLRGTVYPELSREVIASWHPLDEEGLLQFASRFTDLDDDAQRRFRELSTHRKGEPLSVLKFGIYIDQFTLVSFKQMLLRQEEQPDLLAVYFGGVDGPSHAFWKYTFPEQFPSLSPEEKSGFETVLPRYYEWMDDVLGELLAVVDREQTVAIVLSDHGFEAADEQKARIGISGTHENAPNGVFLMNGPGVETGKEVDARSIDFAPTLLYLAGLPVADDMPGRVLAAALTEEFRESYPPAAVPTYEVGDGSLPRAVAGREPSEADEAIKDHLRALGYIE
ncbi:MAG: alkaline phosphatase family protein [Candidatus Brocadiia bacterium]